MSISDSSATMMRAVAAALRDEWLIPDPWPAHLVALTGPANHLPPAVRTRLVRFFTRNLGISPDWATQVSSGGLARWAVDLYDGPQPSQDGPSGEETGPAYDAILIGAPSGGIAHLAALLNAPFLSQHFTTRFRYRGPVDDVAAYQAFGARVAEKILERNPDLAVINHYDPIHDRFLVPHVNYIRMKLLDLPGAYAEFIRRRLRPGGTLLFADCQYSWGQFRVGKRHYFQVGGLGGIADEAWVKGSPEVRSFLAAHGRRQQTGWSVAYPWLPGPESEWGSMPPFRQAVEDFAAQNGFRFRVLRGDTPEDFSQLAFYASYQAALDAGRSPAGVLVDCFTRTSPTAARQSGLLPLWLPYNCSDSLAFLRSMAPSFPRGKPVLLAPAPAYEPAWDTASAADLVAACGEGADITWVGIDTRAYPVDVAAMFRFVPALQTWCDAQPRVPRHPFAVADLEALVGNMAEGAQAGDEAAGAAEGAEPGESG